jgi:hypothetical protein
VSVHPTIAQQGGVISLVSGLVTVGSQEPDVVLDGLDDLVHRDAQPLTARARRRTATSPATSDQPQWLWTATTSDADGVRTWREPVDRTARASIAQPGYPRAGWPGSSASAGIGSASGARHVAASNLSPKYWVSCVT